MRSIPICRPVVVLLVSTMLLATPVAAQPDAFEQTLDEAVAALGAEDYDRGGELLERAAELRSDDPRVDYYRGFVYEKLGECDRARDFYARAAGAAAKWDALRTTARGALEGFDERCVPSSPDPAEVEDRARGGRFGWKLVGWSSLTIGALAMLSVPLKVAVERDALAQSKPYFRERYGCEVDYGDVSGDACDESALEDDEAFTAYQDRVQQSKRTTTYGLIGAGGLVVVGVATLVTLSATSPARVGVTTDGRGVRAVFIWRF